MPEKRIVRGHGDASGRVSVTVKDETETAGTAMYDGRRIRAARQGSLPNSRLP
jgi:hypothetical protein